MLKLVGLVLPLGLDTFAVSLGLGASGATLARRLRLALLFSFFEAVMPLVGLFAGQAIAGAVGDFTIVIAAFILIAVGGWMIREGMADADEERERIAAAAGWRVLLIAVSISLDELAIGFSLGLAGVSVLLAIALIGVQAFGVSLLGLALGRRLSEAVGERAELLAGGVLVLMGLLFLGDHFLGFGLL